MTPTDLETVEVREAAAGGAAKREYVRRIFSEIAPSYDLLNHLLSFNIDRRWRARALEALAWTRVPGGTYLDLCAGTLDVAAQLVRTPGFRGEVAAIDFAEPMLRAGRAKLAHGAIAPAVGDALALPFDDASMDGAIVAFGIRNVVDLDACLVEVRRVLRPGARFVILECSTPPSALVRTGYHAYFHHVLPRIGRLVSGHRTAYTYLPESVKHFPIGDALAGRLASAGFTRVTWRPLTWGVAAIHQGEQGTAL